MRQWYDNYAHGRYRSAVISHGTSEECAPLVINTQLTTKPHTPKNLLRQTVRQTRNHADRNSLLHLLLASLECEGRSLVTFLEETTLIFISFWAVRVLVLKEAKQLLPIPTARLSGNEPKLNYTTESTSERAAHRHGEVPHWHCSAPWISTSSHRESQSRFVRCSAHSWGWDSGLGLKNKAERVHSAHLLRQKSTSHLWTWICSTKRCLEFKQRDPQRESIRQGDLDANKHWCLQQCVD